MRHLILKHLHGERKVALELTQPIIDFFICSRQGCVGIGIGLHYRLVELNELI